MVKYYCDLCGEELETGFKIENTRIILKPNYKDPLSLKEDVDFIQRMLICDQCFDRISGSTYFNGKGLITADNNSDCIEL